MLALKDSTLNTHDIGVKFGVANERGIAEHRTWLRIEGVITWKYAMTDKVAQRNQK